MINYTTLFFESGYVEGFRGLTARHNKKNTCSSFFAIGRQKFNYFPISSHFCRFYLALQRLIFSRE